MTHKQSIGNRIMSVFLSVAILFTMIPSTAMVASAASVNSDRAADPSTMDEWKNFFPITGEISTENAGGVWTDKSVFLDASAFNGRISQDDPQSFIVALSAMAANMNITGMSSVPTDTMLVLDVSGSMNDENNDVAAELVEAANESIDTLLSANKHNRVGVVLYSGPTTQGGAATANDAVLILPLGRYETGTNGEFLSYSRSGGDEAVSLNRSVVYEDTGNAPFNNRPSKTVVGGTYIQKGVILAMDQFVASGNSITVDDPALGTMNRKPVLVLMSDGSPTVGSTNFTAPGAIQLGDGTQTSAALGFVSQLSAAYAKAQIEAKYGTDALVYTLGLGIGNDSIALSVLDPDNANGSTAVDDFWNDIQRNWRGQITFAGYNHIDVGETVSLGGNRSVTKIATPLEQNYVDQYFAANTTNLVQVFQNIMSAIQLQSAYFPTLVAGSEDLSGYISFVDRIGEYMSVTDIKGILIDEHLFSGADLASNFVSGGGALGTYDNPSALGMEMVAAVRARLGIADDDTARTLIGLAYENGQLSYTDDDNYSNYIGWYANAAGEYLGFYNEGTTVLPAATGNAAADPAFVIRSYGYLGAVDESHGVSESDMMYATVQVRKNIVTGEEIVTFAIPAALIPVVTYEVTLDENGELSGLTVSGADNPIRLVYEVALDAGINSFNVKEIVSDEYLADPHNLNADGSVNFYTNQWEHQNTTGYGTVNTYSYFNPSRQNDQFYYTEDAAVYADTNGTLYTGASRPDPNGTFYRAHRVYKNNGSLRAETVYHQIYSEQLMTAIRKDDGSWFIPQGNVRTNWADYRDPKASNPTDTLTDAHLPFVDTTNHEVNEDGYDFYVGATLGNNGKLAVIPETGIKLTKTMAPGAAAPNGPFTFVITNLTNPNDSGNYPGWLIQADGREMETRIQFTNGSATVQCSAGDVLYIGGMTAGDTFRIVEAETVEYVATVTGLSASGTVTVDQNEIKAVAFVNDDRGAGNLTIAKEVEHDFGQDYNIPADKTFTMQVTLSGIGTANATFAAEHSGNPAITSIQTDADGMFTVTLKHGEQLEVFGLPAGTEAAVVEQNPAAGFTPAYWDNGAVGDGKVTVADNNTVSVIVVNDYAPAEVYPVDVTVSGSKTLSGRDWSADDSFAFELQKLLDNGSWQVLGTATANAGAATFTFTDAFANERYTQAGTYYYRIIEIEPDAPLGGVTYDKTVHSFSVIVGDTNMDGQLEITDVVASRPDTTTVTETGNGWNVNASFTNTYSVTGSATVTIDLNKAITSNGGADKSLAGFTFGLYDGDTLVYTSPATTDRGFTRFVLNYTATGTYQYTLKEIVPDPVPAGWTYSSLEIPVTVVVSDDGDGTISAIIYSGDAQPADSDTSIEETFTNIYDPADVELSVDFVSKEISGRDLNDGEFTFEVQDTNGTKILEGTNDADGVVTFDGTLKFDKVGTYFYNIVETSADGNGVVTDKTTYRVTVTVTDVNGQLSASYVLVNATGDTITFKNTYTADPAEHSIVGTKKLNGRVLVNDEFSFVLTEVSFDGNPIQNPQSWAVKNFATETGNIVFPTITYDTAGTYVYSVKEVVPAGGTAYGISYDGREYTVTIVIADDGEGKLFVKSESVSGAGNTLLFENTYKANPTSAQFSGEKQLTGKVDNNLVGGEYEFELYNSDANWTKGTLRETVENAAGGLITFTEIDLTSDEDQYFIVVEKNGGKIIDGVTYDDTEYRVWVEVTDDLKGQLHATVHIYDAEGIPQDKILFNNVYTPRPADITVDIDIIKTVVNKGSDKIGPEGFEFLLKALADGAEEITVKSDENGKAKFTLTFTEDDIGKSFSYKLTEVNGGKANVTYSTAEYAITVVISLDEATNTLVATMTVNEAAVTELVAEFENTYDYTPTIPDNPKTGEKSNLGRWIALAFISGGAAITLCVVEKKKRRQASM